METQKGAEQDDAAPAVATPVAEASATAALTKRFQLEGLSLQTNADKKQEPVAEDKQLSLRERMDKLQQEINTLKSSPTSADERPQAARSAAPETLPSTDGQAANAAAADTPTTVTATPAAAAAIAQLTSTNVENEKEKEQDTTSALSTTMISTAIPARSKSNGGEDDAARCVAVLAMDAAPEARMISFGVDLQEDTAMKSRAMPLRGNSKIPIDLQEETPISRTVTLQGVGVGVGVGCKVWVCVSS